MRVDYLWVGEAQYHKSQFDIYVLRHIIVCMRHFWFVF